MTVAETVDRTHRPRIGNFQFDPVTPIFETEDEAHADLLMVYFSTLRKLDEFYDQRTSDKKAIATFLELFQIWKMYVRPSKP